MHVPDNWCVATGSLTPTGSPPRVRVRVNVATIINALLIKQRARCAFVGQTATLGPMADVKRLYDVVMGVIVFGEGRGFSEIFWICESRR